MRGHIAQKGKRYYAVIFEGTDPQTGKPLRRWHPAGTRRREAERLLTTLLGALDAGTYRPPDRVTVGEYLLERWLPNKATRLRPTTAALYEATIRRYIVPAIGQIPLQSLRAEDLDGLYARLLREGRPGGAGSGLSPGTVRQVHAVMSGALTDASRKGTVTRNVARDADPPPLNVRRRDAAVWSAEELRTFLAAAESDDRYPLWVTLATTGMRRGEAVGLRWRDVDLDGARLVVRRQLVAARGRVIESAPKTTHGERTINLDARTVRLLRLHRRSQREQTLALGRRAHTDDHVFSPPGLPGSADNPEHVTRAWRALVAGVDVPTIRLHDLRHTHASLMLAAGATPKVVCERLGHAHISITLTMYQAVLPGMQAAAAEEFGAAVFGAASD